MGALAQDLSEDELLKLFLAQRDAYKAAVEGNTALTRGLTLVTADDVDVATEVETTETAADASGDTTAGSTDVVVADTTTETAPETKIEPKTETVLASNETTTLAQMPDDMKVDVRIDFAFDSAALDDAQKPKLQKLCNVMRVADIQLFRIIGHTDASGTDEYNERLSRLRAEEVQRFFVNDCGIAANRLEAVGLGERFPLDDFDPDSDQNRRVEFQALS
jgi:outer membrane protein OmpA-like peptidoglycan-associated protein